MTELIVAHIKEEETSITLHQVNADDFLGKIYYFI